MRVILLAIVLAAAGLSGCLGSDDAALDPSTATTDPPGSHIPTFPNGTAAPTDHEISDCGTLVHVQPAPSAVFEDRVPPGFTIIPRDPAGELATVLFVGQACTWMDGSDLGIAKAYLIVDPPDLWENPEASGHGLYLTVMTDSSDLASVLTAWGLGPVVSVGDVTLATIMTPTGGTGSLQASAEGRTLTIDTVVAGQPESGPGPLARMFVADETLNVTGAVDLEPGEYAGGLQGSSRITFSGFMDEGPLPAYPATGYQFWGAGQIESYVELPELEWV